MNTAQISKLYMYFRNKDKQVDGIREIKNFLSLIGKEGYSKGKIVSFCKSDFEIYYQKQSTSNIYHKCPEADKLLKEVLIEEQNYLFDKFKLKLQEKEKEITENIEQDIKNIMEGKLK